MKKQKTAITGMAIFILVVLLIVAINYIPDDGLGSISITNIIGNISSDIQDTIPVSYDEDGVPSWEEISYSEIEYSQGFDGNRTADYFIGSGEFLTNLNIINTSYYLATNPFSFYNSTDFSISDYYLLTNPYDFYNSTDFDFNDYRLLSNNTFYGKVGIGTTSPSQELHVVGDIAINDSYELYMGDAQDVSMGMNSTSFNIIDEIGSILFFFQGFLKYIFDGDVEINGELHTSGEYLDNMSWTRDLVLDMPFQAGSQTRDFSGEQNDGTVTGATWNSTGGYNGYGAYEFDGIDDKINMNPISFNGIGDMTISAWIYPIGWGGGDYGRIIDNSNLIFYLENNDGNERLVFISSGGDGAFGTDNSISLNEWQHVVAVRPANGDNVDLYVNGINIIGIDQDSGTPVASTDFNIGGRSVDNNRNFNGTIDEVMIWNRSLSAEEIKNLYDMRRPETSFLDDVVIEGDLNVTGKITNSLAHIFGLSTAVGTVASTGVWYNITMNLSHVDTHLFTALDDNVTIIVPHDGHFTITYGMGIKDASASPSAHVGMRVVKNDVEIVGSYIEEDTSKQNADIWMEHTTHAELSAGDRIQLQYVASDTDVTIAQDDTYATQGFSAFGYIQEILH